MKGGTLLKPANLDMVMFVGVSLLQDFWIYYGLPRIYYWDYKKQLEKEVED